MDRYCLERSLTDITSVFSKPERVGAARALFATFLVTAYSTNLDLDVRVPGSS